MVIREKDNKIQSWYRYDLEPLIHKERRKEYYLGRLGLNYFWGNGSSDELWWDDSGKHNGIKTHRLCFNPVALGQFTSLLWGLIYLLI